MGILACLAGAVQAAAGPGAGRLYSQAGAGPAGAAGGAVQAVPKADTPASLGRLRVGKILFLGNSITLHGPSAKVDWSGNWGMAASAIEKDYVHVLAKAIADITGHAPELLVDNIADFERRHAEYDVKTALTRHLEFRADVVVLAIGENVPALTTEEAKSRFAEALKRLLAALKEAGAPTVFVRSCFWPNQPKDAILKQACADAGGVFVDIGALGRDAANAARSERRFTHDGVGGHPGDRGMQAIADALLAAMKQAGAEPAR